MQHYKILICYFMQVQVGNNIPHSSAMLQNNIFHPHPAYLRSHSTANPEAYSSSVEMPHLNLLRTIVGGEGKWGSCWSRDY